MENQNENLKKSKGTIIAIIILVLLVLGLGGYIVYDKLLTKESTEANEPEKTEKVEAPKEDLNAIANSLFEKSEKYKLYIFGDVENLNNLTVKNELSEAQIETLYFYFLLNNITINKTNVDNYLKDLYNIQLTNYPDIIFGGFTMPLATFDKTKNDYVENNVSHDAMENKPLISKVANIEKNVDNYVLTITRVYEPAMGLIETPEQEYYADAQFTTKINELHQFTNKSEIGEVLKTDKEKAKQYYEQNYDQFKNLKPQYKYTFAKDNNNYYLVSYEVIK